MHQLLRISAFVLPIFALLLDIYLRFSCIWFEHLAVLVVLPIVAWIIGNFAYDFVNREVIESTNKAVLITGCDTGFGNRLAGRLVDLGFHVYAAVLFPDGSGALELTSKYPTNLTILKLDVTSQSDVESAVTTIKSNRIPLWAVVNNAGIAFNCSWDWGHDVDDYKRILEVNTLGTIRVAKNCVPLLRESNGRIINVASAAGRLVTSHLCHYSISKFGVRVFSDSIRRDTFNDDIKVVTIEPAFYRTSIVNQEALIRSREIIKAQTPPEIAKYYGAETDKVNQNYLNSMELLMHEDVNEVIDAMVKAVTLKHPKLFYRCTGFLTYCLVWIGSMLPEVIVDFAMGLVFRFF